jgi:hypothetical protein
MEEEKANDPLHQKVLLLRSLGPNWYTTSLFNFLLYTTGYRIDDRFVSLSLTAGPTRRHVTNRQRFSLLSRRSAAPDQRDLSPLTNIAVQL